MYVCEYYKCTRSPARRYTYIPIQTQIPEKDADTHLKGRRKVAVEASLKSTYQFAAVVTQYRHLVDKPPEDCAHRRILQTLNYRTTLLLGLLCMRYALDPPKPYSRRNLGVPKAEAKARSVHTQK
jgi:hypothetical protein